MDMSSNVKKQDILNNVRIYKQKRQHRQLKVHQVTTRTFKGYFRLQ